MDNGLTQQKIKILLIDDSNVIALFIKSLLNINFYDLQIIVDGKEGFDFLMKSENPPDVILLDYELPSMNGLEILKKLSENKKEYAIIFITSDNRIETAVTAMKDGALDFICKNSKDIDDLPLKISKVHELHTSRIKKREYEEKLEELNSTKDMFFSIIAHDLRNPFTAIIGYCDFLLMSMQDKTIEDFKEFIDIVKNASTKAYKLLENLLVWARTQTGHIEFKKEKFDLKKVIDETIDILLPQANNKNIQIFSTIIDEKEIYADLNMISTVIRNLISNSIKFTKQGGTITIYIKNIKDFIEINVKDTGIGISKENLNNLFKINKKQSTLGTAKETGTGLGLILCKEFVEKNGGSIKVESELGKGTIFSFTIPVIN